MHSSKFVDSVVVIGQSGLKRSVWFKWLSWLAVLLCWVSGVGEAQRQIGPNPRWKNEATRGDIVMIGNVNTVCTTDSSATRSQIRACNSARIENTRSNNSVRIIKYDADGSTNTATTNSSIALLNIPAGSSILWAGLYWSGGKGSSASARTTVLFTTPNITNKTITAQQVDNIRGVYQSFAEVTNDVSGSGTYSVGNIYSTGTSNTWSSWVLIVAFQNANEPTRNLAVFDGLERARSASDPVDITVSGFLTPSVGTVKSKVGVVAYDGDAGSSEGAAVNPRGSLKFGPSLSNLNPISNTVNPRDDVFNSTISNLGTLVTTGSDPNYPNTLGLDADMLEPNIPLPNGSTSAVVRVVGTRNDWIYPGVITLGTEIFVPIIKDSLIKNVTDVNGGNVEPGDELEYEIIVKNTGNDGAQNVVVTDAIPANATFKPGSLSIDAGPNQGGKTDAAGDDQAEFDAINNRVVFRVGNGADANNGGSLPPPPAAGAESRVKFSVIVDAGTEHGTNIDNTAVVNYVAQTLGRSITNTSDNDPNQPGDQPARVVVTGADLKVTKTHEKEFPVNAEGEFKIVVENQGPAPSSGVVTVTDTLPNAAGFTNISAAGTGWNCPAVTGQIITCTRSDALAVGQSYPDIIVKATATNKGSWSNTAVVSGGSEGSDTLSDNTSTDNFDVVGVNLTVNKTHANDFNISKASDFTIVVTNSGGETASGTVTVVDTLPANMTVNSIGGTDWTCNIATVSCTYTKTVAAGDNYPALVLNITPTAAGTFTNTVTVSGGGETSDATGDNTASVPYTVEDALPSISLTKTVRNITENTTAGTVSQALPGEVLEYCITFSNTGGTAPDFVINDSLPSVLMPMYSAYSSGRGLKLSMNGGAEQLLTSIVDGDSGEYVVGNVKLTHGILNRDDTGVLCFRGQVQ